MTKPVAAELIAAAGEINGNVPASQYAGFEPTGKYYAYDPATRTYWAGGSLLPRTDSSAAAVSVQDNGSYNIFRRTRNSRWTAYDVGQAGVGGTTCPVRLPKAVLHLWHWPDNSCLPPR